MYFSLLISWMSFFPSSSIPSHDHLKTCRMYGIIADYYTIEGKNEKGS